MNKEEEAGRLINKALANISYDDVAHRAFLKPIEIALKTYRTQMIYQDCTITPGALPRGLKIAVGSSPQSSKKYLQDIQEITSKETFEQIRQNNKDNMLTLMKKKSGMKLAICVCMYSQTQQMLKSTLSGIAENIANMVAYEHVPPDDIGVFVIMDGIEKVDKTIVDFFEEMERSNHINLGDSVVPSLNDRQMNKKYNKMSKEQINQFELKNVSNYLFDPAELDERNNLRFNTVRDEYHEVRDLHKQCKKVNKTKAVYKDLPTKIQEFFLDEVRRLRRSDHNQTQEQVQKLSPEVLLEEYASDVDQNRALVSRALEEADKYCSNYLSNKADLSYLSYFRKKIYFDKSTTHKGTKLMKKTHGQDHFNAHFDQSRPSTVMNLFMCCKYANAGKLSSHNWFLNGFCKQLRPKYCVLMDVGLKPDTTSILKMYKYMCDNKNIGGVCGYMSLKMEMADSGDGVRNQCHDCCSNCITNIIGIQRTQQVEYHIAHVIDKPFEASFGFIHVLPGAYSAYNMNAIHNYEDKQDDILLKNYFKSISDKIADRQPLQSKVSTANVIMRTVLPEAINSCCVKVDPKSDQAMLYNENVYLAEDRILCMGIHKRGYDMAFLPDAYAEVDPVTSIPDLMGQRKRWMNGSYFAFDKVKRELAAFERRHGCQLGLNIQILYLTFMNALVYFAPAIFLFTFHIAFLALRQDVLDPWLGPHVKQQLLDWFVYTIDFIYTLLIIVFFIFSLHLKNSNKFFKPLIYVVANVFGLLIYFVVAVVLVDIIRGLLTNSEYLTISAAEGQTLVDAILVTVLRYMLIASFVFYFVPVFLFWLMFCRFDPFCQVMLGFPAFLFYTPTYLIILNIYSLCKIDDMSWGTKGLDVDADDSNSLAKEWKLIKYIHVIKYLIWNIILASVLCTLGQYQQYKFWITFSLVTMVGLTLIIKTFIGLIYLLVYRCRSIGINNDPKIDILSRINGIIKKYERAILEEVRKNLDNIKQEYMREEYKGSFIQASRTNRYINKALNNQSRIQKQRSAINRQHSTKLIKKGKKKENKNNEQEAPSKQAFQPSAAESNENLYRVDLDDDYYHNPERPQNQRNTQQQRPQNNNVQSQSNPKKNDPKDQPRKGK